MTLVVYTKDNESIVLPKKKEKELLPLYFDMEMDIEGSGRDITDYEREVYYQGVSIRSSNNVIG